MNLGKPLQRRTITPRPEVLPEAVPGDAETPAAAEVTGDGSAVDAQPAG